MRGCQRGAGPKCLHEHGQTWSDAWKQKCNLSNEAPNWSWGTHAGKPVNHHILPHLGSMTNHHCAYCDGFPLDTTGCETIDHFRPKNRNAFPELAFIWDNLFLACELCQGKKRDKFDDALLRPDVPGFAFHLYFVYKELTGNIEPHPGASPADQNRAETSIRLYGLNADGRPQARRRELSRYRSLAALGKQGSLDEWPYRFLMELAA